MTNNFKKNNYTAVLGSKSRPGPEFAGPGPEDQVQGL